MAADPGNALHFFIPLAFCLVGFHGALFYLGPLKKTASWCLFQLGLFVFLFQLASTTNPFPCALALVILAVTTGMAILFAAFCMKAGGRTKIENGKTARKRSQ